MRTSLSGATVLLSLQFLAKVDIPSLLPIHLPARKAVLITQLLPPVTPFCPVPPKAEPRGVKVGSQSLPFLEFLHTKCNRQRLIDPLKVTGPGLDVVLQLFSTSISQTRWGLIGPLTHTFWSGVFLFRNRLQSLSKAIERPIITGNAALTPQLEQ